MSRPLTDSTVDVLRAELADLKDQRRRHADDCVGVRGDGYRDEPFFVRQQCYSALIEQLEQRIAKEESCDGSSECTAARHIHGCFADHGNCDEPREHEQIAKEETQP